MGLLLAVTGPLPSARSSARSSFPLARHLRPTSRDPQCPPCHPDILGCHRCISLATGHSQSAGSCPRLGTAAGAGGEGAGAGGAECGAGAAADPGAADDGRSEEGDGADVRGGSPQDCSPA